MKKRLIALLIAGLIAMSVHPAAAACSGTVTYGTRFFNGNGTTVAIFNAWDKFAESTTPPSATRFDPASEVVLMDFPQTSGLNLIFIYDSPARGTVCKVIQWQRVQDVEYMPATPNGQTNQTD